MAGQEPTLSELLADSYKKARAYDSIEKQITDAGLCIGSEWAGDLPAMVRYLVQEAKKPEPRRILVAEAAVENVRRELALTREGLEVWQERYKALDKACRALLNYRKRNALNFQLEKADDFLNEISKNLWS